jgi:hypothetical protein
MWIAIVSIGIGYIIWLVQFHINKKWEVLENFWVSFDKVITPLIYFLDDTNVFFGKANYDEFCTRVLDMTEADEYTSRISLYFDEKKMTKIHNFNKELNQKLWKINYKFWELKRTPGDPHCIELFESDEERKQFVKELKDMREGVLKFIRSNAPFRFWLLGTAKALKELIDRVQ